MSRLTPEDERRIRVETASMIYRGDHDVAFKDKRDKSALLVEIDAQRLQLELAEGALSEIANTGMNQHENRIAEEYFRLKGKL